MIIARGLRFSAHIKHCPKKEKITCLVATFYSSVFSEPILKEQLKGLLGKYCHGLRS